MCRIFSKVRRNAPVSQKYKGWMKMKERIMRFMQGRYGVDTFCRFLLVAGLIVVFLSAFLGSSVVGMIFYLLGWVMIIYCYFRMFSRNVSNVMRRIRHFLRRHIRSAVSSRNRRISGTREEYIISIHVRTAGRRSVSREERERSRSAARNVGPHLLRRADTSICAVE